MHKQGRWYLDVELDGIQSVSGKVVLILSSTLENTYIQSVAENLHTLQKLVLGKSSDICTRSSFEFEDSTQNGTPSSKKSAYS